MKRPFGSWRSSGRREGALARAAIGAGALVLTLSAFSARAQFNTGDVFAASQNGVIERFSPSGAFIQTLNTGTGSSYMTGMCFDGALNLYATNFTTGQLSKFSNTGTLLNASFATGLSSPESCVRDTAGNFYISQTGGGVRKTDSAGATLASYPVGRTDWIDLSADQCTLLYTTESSFVGRYNVCTSTALSNFATGLPQPCYALRIRPNGEVMVGCASQVVRLDSGGTSIQTYPGSGFTPATASLFALNLDPDGATFWTGEFTSGRVYRINIATGAQVTSFLTPPAISVYGLAIAGEITVAVPTPTATPAVGVPTPTSTPTATPTAAPSVATGIPTLDGRSLALLAIALGAIGMMLVRRLLQ